MNQNEFNMESSKDKVIEKCVKIINILLSSGNDEDAHYWWVINLYQEKIY